jgi:hypothetical protein
MARVLRRPPAGDGRPVALTLVALTALAALLGVVGLVGVLRERAAAGATASATLGDLTAAVDQSGWTSMDMGAPTSGFQMPAAMMPGMPAAGQERLAVTVTVVNTGAAARPIRPEAEFALRAGGSGGRWTPRSSTFGELPRLAPRSAVTGVLYFDLPPERIADSPAWLEWAHEGTRARIPVPGAGAAPHAHGS